jgi:hypothetical protein
VGQDCGKLAAVWQIQVVLGTVKDVFQLPEKENANPHKNKNTRTGSILPLAAAAEKIPK